MNGFCDRCGMAVVAFNVLNYIREADHLITLPSGNYLELCHSHLEAHSAALHSGGATITALRNEEALTHV